MFSDRFPKGGETVFGSEFFTGFGGESENIQSVPHRRTTLRSSLIVEIITRI